MKTELYLLLERCHHCHMQISYMTYNMTMLELCILLSLTNVAWSEEHQQPKTDLEATDIVSVVSLTLQTLLSGFDSNKAFLTGIYV